MRLSTLPSVLLALRFVTQTRVLMCVCCVSRHACVDDRLLLRLGRRTNSNCSRAWGPTTASTTPARMSSESLEIFLRICTCECVIGAGIESRKSPKARVWMWCLSLWAARYECMHAYFRHVFFLPSLGTFHNLTCSVCRSLMIVCGRSSGREEWL